jgi:hypothetical protein
LIASEKKNSRCRNHRLVLLKKKKGKKESPARFSGRSDRTEPKDSRPLIGAQEYEFVSGK